MRVAPVAHGLDELLAGGCDELAEVHLKTLGFGGLDADEGLFDVVVGGSICAVQEGVGAAKEDVHMGTDRVGVVVQGQLGGLQAELVG